MVIRVLLLALVQVSLAMPIQLAPIQQITVTTSVSGEVVDETGGALPGIEVTLASLTEPVTTQTATTDASGRFTFPRVPVGAYRLTAASPGFKVATREISATVGAAASIRISLPIGDVGETIPVSTEPPPPPPDNERNFAKIPVFYATDRNAVTGDPPQFGTQREPANVLHLGRFVVSVPRDHHRPGTIERPAIWSFYREDPTKHFVIVRRELLGYEPFYRQVRSLVQKSADKQAFVFIHGFNVGFDDAVYRTAQLSYDLGFDGAPIVYSWPSVASVVDYRIDERNNEWTVEHLRWFLEDVRQKSGAKVVHLIAHSMGNRALAAALGQMAPSTQGQARFSQVIMAAPDIDAGVFPVLAAKLKRIAGRVTLYASEHDLALIAAAKYDTFQRVGSTKPNVVIIDGIDTVDASKVDTNFLAHSYVGDSTKVLSDIFYAIRGIAANARAFIEARGQPTGEYWAFK